MSRASICVSRRTSALASPAPPVAASSAVKARAGGATSWASRCRVQSPPRTTSVGMSGRGTIDPTSSPSPVNSKEVT
jgi:hypothetical protein